MARSKRDELLFLLGYEFLSSKADRFVDAKKNCPVCAKTANGLCHRHEYERAFFRKLEDLIREAQTESDGGK